MPLLLQTERDLLLFAIDVQHHHFEFLVDGDHFARVTNAVPAHIGDMEQAVDAAQVDERAELGDVLDHALAGLADFQFLQQRFASFLALTFDKRTTADDDVATSFVDLEHFALHRAADVIADVGGTTDIDLAGGKEHVDATDVDEQTTLDLAGDQAGDHVAFLDLLENVEPLVHLARFALADADHAAVVGRGSFVFQVFDQHPDEIANLRRRIFGIPFVERDRAFALEADVDQNHAVADSQNAAFDDLVDVKPFDIPAGHFAVDVTNVLGGLFEHSGDVGVVLQRAN